MRTFLIWVFSLTVSNVMALQFIDEIYLASFIGFASAVSLTNLLLTTFDKLDEIIHLLKTIKNKGEKDEI